MNDVRRHTAPEDTKTTIRMPGPGDAAAIMSIDRDGLGTSHASFRENPHDWSSFQATFAGERGLALVAEAASVVVGWAGISPTSTRSVYRGVGEVSIYVARGIQGKGFGRVLLEAIISRSEERAIGLSSHRYFRRTKQVSRCIAAAGSANSVAAGGWVA